MERRESKKSRKYRPAKWWRELVSGQSASGESVRAVCERAGVVPSSFYRWQRRFAGEAQEQQFAEVEISLVTECEVRCLSGRRVVVRGAVPQSVLAGVISAAEEAK